MINFCLSAKCKLINMSQICIIGGKTVAQVLSVISIWTSSGNYLEWHFKAGLNILSILITSQFPLGYHLNLQCVHSLVKPLFT